MKVLRVAHLWLLCAVVAVAQPALQLDPDNPHYFLFRGHPTVLVTSGEHYGAVINRSFNYVTYLDELKRDHLNLTRVWVGPYRENVGDFHIAGNTLAPTPGAFITPWARSQTPGASDKGNRFDLSRWNKKYFERLVDFVAAAQKRGIVVEVNLFNAYYKDSMWDDSPLNSKNNVNGIGDLSRSEVLTLKHPELVEVEDKMVRKIVHELNRFDNVYYEICNECYATGVPVDWQRHISSLIAEEEAKLPIRHLISQNVANGSARVDDLDPHVSILNFHYSRPPKSVEMNYNLNRAIGFNETGFDGNADSTYRVQAWSFLTAGGALFNNLDFTFSVGHERGDFIPGDKTPGGGGPAFRKQMGVLKDFFDHLPLPEMKPDSEIIVSGVPQGAHAYVLARPGAIYLMYLCHFHVEAVTKNVFPTPFSVDASPHTASVVLNLPAGSYRARWIDPVNGRVIHKVRFRHERGSHTFTSPQYGPDIALYVKAER